MVRFITFRLDGMPADLSWYLLVPSPPTLLLDRLKCLEEHIIRLEKDYPPWAALHFSQPNRGVRCILHLFIYLFMYFLFLLVAAASPTDAHNRPAADAFLFCDFFFGTGVVYGW